MLPSYGCAAGREPLSWGLTLSVSALRPVPLAHLVTQLVLRDEVIVESALGQGNCIALSPTGVQGSWAVGSWGERGRRGLLLWSLVGL